MGTRAGVGALAVLGLAGVLPAGELRRDESWVLERVRQVRASDTGAWRKIPWTGLAAGGAAGQRGGAPARFLFTHDGNIDTGRC